VQAARIDLPEPQTHDCNVGKPDLGAEKASDHPPFPPLCSRDRQPFRCEVRVGEGRDQPDRDRRQTADSMWWRYAAAIVLVAHVSTVPTCVSDRDDPPTSRSQLFTLTLDETEPSDVSSACAPRVSE